MDLLRGSHSLTAIGLEMRTGMLMERQRRLDSEKVKHSVILRRKPRRLGTEKERRMERRKDLLKLMD